MHDSGDLYWCANCDDTTVDQHYDDDCAPICVICKCTCEEISVVIHELQKRLDVTRKTGFMCGRDFHDEIEGRDANIYSTWGLLKDKNPCWKQCGIVKVSVEIVEEVSPPDMPNKTIG